MTRGAPRGRFRQRLLVVFLVAMLIPYGRQMLSSPTTGQDFRAFFAAATVVAHGGDPYNWPSLAAAEYQLYDAPHGLAPGNPAYYEFLAYPEGPWLAFALAPITGLPWPVAYALFAVLLGLVLVGASFASFTLLGWSRRRAALAAGCTLLSAVGFINLFMGQVSVLVFGAFMAAWLLARRGRPWLAGAVLALVWVKPNIGLPLPLVLALLEPGVARRLVSGFVVASAAAFGLAAAVMGLHFLEWPLQVPRMWQAVQGLQPDIASVESFFYPGLSGWIKTAALVLTLLAAILYGGWAIRRAPDAHTRGLTLLIIWLFALPFVQSYDLILLLPAIAVLLGPRLDGWDDLLVELTVWGFVVIPLLYFLGARLGYFNGFTVIPFSVLVIAWHRRMLARSAVPAQVRAA
ncbi:MAG TPA: glycosyltransferase family 87 protein [Candidatus Dormibacteraeota bacterium]|nr:glycosyltransferase family 87 protein [Candidatus Dormibacteraeota bacterium]